MIGTLIYDLSKASNLEFFSIGIFY